MTAATTQSANPQRAGGARFWIMVTLGWMLWGVLIGLSKYYRILGFNPDVPFWPPFLNSVTGWMFWAPTTALVLWLGRTFRIDRANWQRNGVLHLVLSLVIAFGLTILYCLSGAWFYATLNNEVFIDAWNNYGMPGFLFAHSPWWVLVYWMILGAGYAFEYYRVSNERRVRAVRLEGELAQAQLLALRFQLQPHFLFNTMHSIAALVEEKRNDEAIEMLAGLSDLLRSSLDGFNRHEVKLREELAYLDKYIETEKVRFGDRLTIERAIDDDILNALVPPFILQPLVENAIRHGIERKRGEGIIRIGGRRDGEVLHLEVSDNGQGVDLRDSGKRGNGIGLRSTRARLHTLYHDAGHLELDNGNQQGTIARVTLPYHTQPIKPETEAAHDLSD